MNNIEKLTLKEIASYLPYGLKFTVNYPDGSIGQNEMTILNIMNFVDETTSGKIILRPLSDLTKEITVNGETFVPLVTLYNSDYYRKGMNEVISNVMHLKNQIFWYSRLFEWHFDVFGLIKKGLAIDINTL